MFAKIIAAVILSALTLAAQSAPRRKPLYPKPTFTKRPSSKAAKHSRASGPAIVSEANTLVTSTISYGASGRAPITSARLAVSRHHQAPSRRTAVPNGNDSSSEPCSCSFGRCDVSHHETDSPNDAAG